MGSISTVSTARDFNVRSPYTAHAICHFASRVDSAARLLEQEKPRVLEYTVRTALEPVKLTANRNENFLSEVQASLLLQCEV